MSQADGTLTLGVDLGGTKVEMALVDEAGGVVASSRHETRSEEGADRVISAIANSARSLVLGAGRPVGAAGVGVAGQVEKDTGAVTFAPNLRWTDVPLRSVLEQALGMPVAVINDVRAITIGEWRHGAGRGASDLVCLFVGTGVGGGVISGGHLVEGSTNAAGELGHVTIVSDGRACTCRNRGCLEAYAGGWAIAERAQERVLGEPDAGRRLIALAGSAEKVTATTVTQAYGEGDTMAKQLVEETALYLAAGLTGLVNAFNPSLLILGGGVVRGIPDLVALAEPLVRARALEAALADLTIATAELGDKAGVIGAASLARGEPATG